MATTWPRATALCLVRIVQRSSSSGCNPTSTACHGARPATSCPRSASECATARTFACAGMVRRCCPCVVCCMSLTTTTTTTNLECLVATSSSPWRRRCRAIHDARSFGRGPVDHLDTQQPGRPRAADTHRGWAGGAQPRRRRHYLARDCNVEFVSKQPSNTATSVLYIDPTNNKNELSLFCVQRFDRLCARV